MPGPESGPDLHAAPSSYVGRFAPSPTGELHFGSLIAAVGSYLQARCHNGQWLLRVEDIDPPREVAGSAERILSDLNRLGFMADAPVLWQSSRHSAYQNALNQLLENGSAFYCGCSRSDLPPGGVYPGTCRNGLPEGREARSIRVRVNDESIQFVDRIVGPVEMNLAATCGDFVIRRADGLTAYQLAVVVDDAFQGITEVVRGQDLLDSTPRQIHLQRLLGLNTPEYLHLPLALAEDGKKLGKREGSDPLSLLDPVGSLLAALDFLGQQPPILSSLEDIWSWAMENWSLEHVPASGTSGYTVPSS